MEVFGGDDDDKCSYKSAVTGNRVQRGLYYYKNKVCECACISVQELCFSY